LADRLNSRHKKTPAEAGVLKLSKERIRLLTEITQQQR
jgi:hypothetical protein